MISHYEVIRIKKGEEGLVLPEHIHLFNHLDGDEGLFVVNNTKPRLEFYEAKDFFYSVPVSSFVANLIEAS